MDGYSTHRGTIGLTKKNRSTDEIVSRYVITNAMLVNIFPVWMSISLLNRDRYIDNISEHLACENMRVHEF